MATLTETTEYAEGIYQIETTDPVIGGADGISNVQAKQLANRTNFLKNLLTKVIDGTQSVAKALKLATARKISLSGAVTGNANFDGSADITINVTLSDGQITINSINGLSTALANKQDSDATLSALAQVSTAANKLIYATAADTFTTTDLTAFMRTLLDDTDAAAARATLGAAPTASPTFTGTVTAPTFTGVLNGNAATATNASAVNGVGVGSEGLPFLAGFGTDGKLAYYAGLNLDTLASTNRRCTFSGSAQAPTTGFYYLDQYAYQGGAYLMQVIADLDTASHSMFLRKKVNNVWTAWKKIAVEDGSTNAYNVRVESARVADELNTTVGSAPSFSNRAWLCANGTTGALYASGNIAAVTDNGVGDFTANFLSALPHANYAVFGSASGVITQSRSATIAASAVNAPPYLKTAYGCRLFFGSNGTNDADIFTVAFIC